MPSSKDFCTSSGAGNGVRAFGNRAQRITRESGAWHVETSSGAVFQAGVVVNAAGAWGDEVAAIAGVKRLGLVPKRRTASIINPSPRNVEHWPMVWMSGNDGTPGRRHAHV